MTLIFQVKKTANSFSEEESFGQKERNKKEGQRDTTDNYILTYERKGGNSKDSSVIILIQTPHKTKKGN